MAKIPSYIEHRIRRCVPADSFVVPGSTPVVAFGDAQKARVATLGLDPSRVEFLDRAGRELVGPARRLATHRSLGTAELECAPAAIICQVLDDCNTYFQRQPYRRWFDQLMPMLQACGASYYDGSACHLDLVQWATDPTWARLKPATTRKSLLVEDAAFLFEQLQNEHLEILLVNGRAVIQQLRRTLVELEHVDTIAGFAQCDAKLFAGTIGPVRVIGWSTNLQSSFGVTRELRAELARRIAGAVGKEWPSQRSRESGRIAEAVKNPSTDGLNDNP